MTTYRGFVSDDEAGLLAELAVAPISKAGTVVRSNLLCRLSKKGLVTYVFGTLGGRKAQGHVLTVAGAEWLSRHPVARPVAESVKEAA